MTPSSPPRILTFNHHESFLAAMAPLLMPIEVVVKKGGLLLTWNPAARKVPKNFKLIDFDTAKSNLKNNTYDYIVCHTIKNLLWLFGRHRTKTVFVAHIPLYWNSPLSFFKSSLKLLILLVYRAFHQTEFVAVSPWKSQTWLLKAVLTQFYPIAFPDDLVKTSPSTQDPAIAVIVGNQIKSRGRELGWDLIEEMLKKIPLRILGNNADIPSSLCPKDFPDFVRLFSESAIYVYTIKRPYGDGYNTAMLEAMLLGLAVVSVPNPSSPLVDGHNGFIAKTSQEMIEKIILLQKTPALRTLLGRNAQATIAEKFNQKNFLDSWRQIFSSKDLLQRKPSP